MNHTLTGSPQSFTPQGNWFSRQFRRLLIGDGPYLVLLLPLLIFVAVIAIYPLFFSFRISLFDYRLTDPNQTQTFVGLDNYIRAFTDPVVVSSFSNTLTYVAGTVVGEILLGLGLALLFSAETKLAQIIRSFLLMPMALPPLVVGLIWKSLYNADFGVIPYYLKLLGMDVGHGPLGEIATAMPAVIIIDIWEWTPLLMVIFLAGLKSLPNEPYEAAYVDGASRWQSFTYITLPLLKPTFLIALLLRTMQAFKVFDTIYATTAGGPGSATTVLNYRIYTVGMTFFDMGYAAALANILLVVIAILSILYVMVMERQQA
ncbi:MAG: sugar ABC transporter permease [Chloroflexi bacterium]|nr:sugar ABC transporter permease [Anaerolineaceae bacterium]NMB90487.1 sugar ABC transporter permease [Chloroflexota bacterium]